VSRKQTVVRAARGVLAAILVVLVAGLAGFAASTAIAFLPPSLGGADDVSFGSDGRLYAYYMVPLSQGSTDSAALPWGVGASELAFCAVFAAGCGVGWHVLQRRRG